MGAKGHGGRQNRCHWCAAAGQVGASIAHVPTVAGHEVGLLDVGPEILDHAMAGITYNLSCQIVRGEARWELRIGR